MNGKRVVRIALLAVVVATLAIVFRPQGQDISASAPAVGDEPLTGTTYVAYYFHGNVRCDTCRSIEAQAESAVRDGFPVEIANGTLEWRVVNTDQPDNAHFIEEYGLTHGTVVLVERDGNDTRRFTALDRVWELVHDEESEFRSYVQDEVAGWMRSGS